MLDEGLYGVTYEGGGNGLTEFGDALAFLRDGTILGSDRWGGLITGSYDIDETRKAAVVRVRFEIPPGGELVTGFAPGPSGGSVECYSEVPLAAPETTAVFEVKGQRLGVTLTYLGPAPGDARR